MELIIRINFFLISFPLLNVASIHLSSLCGWVVFPLCSGAMKWALGRDDKSIEGNRSQSFPFNGPLPSLWYFFLKKGFMRRKLACSGLGSQNKKNVLRLLRRRFRSLSLKKEVYNRKTGLNMLLQYYIHTVILWISPPPCQISVFRCFSVLSASS